MREKSYQLQLLSLPLASLPSGFFADFIRFSPRGDGTDMTNRRYTEVEIFVGRERTTQPGTAALFTATIKKRKKKERKENDGALVFPDEIGAPP